MFATTLSDITPMRFLGIIVVLSSYWPVILAVGFVRSDRNGFAVDYLQKYGYLDGGSRRAASQVLSMESAVKKFQDFAGLPLTGKLDEVTLSKMAQPRCGVRDFGAARFRVKRQTLIRTDFGKWPTNQLTYKIVKRPATLNATVTDREIKRAFEMWSSVANLTITEVPASEEADMEISFVKGDHGDHEPFDGSKGMLAHAFFPPFGGNTHFDDAENWTSDSAAGVNLFQVATHEFGHALGLGHSKNQRALMAPFYQPFSRSFSLQPDDIKEIQKLYGAKSTEPQLSEDAESKSFPKDTALDEVQQNIEQLTIVPTGQVTTHFFTALVPAVNSSITSNETEDKVRPQTRFFQQTTVPYFFPTNNDYYAQTYQTPSYPTSYSPSPTNYYQVPNNAAKYGSKYGAGYSGYTPAYPGGYSPSYYPYQVPLYPVYPPYGGYDKYDKYDKYDGYSKYGSYDKDYYYTTTTTEAPTTTTSPRPIVIVLQSPSYPSYPQFPSLFNPFTNVVVGTPTTTAATTTTTTARTTTTAAPTVILGYPGFGFPASYGGFTGAYPSYGGGTYVAGTSGLPDGTVVYGNPSNYANIGTINTGFTGYGTILRGSTSRTAVDSSKRAANVTATTNTIEDPNGQLNSVDTRRTADDDTENKLALDAENPNTTSPPLATPPMATTDVCSVNSIDAAVTTGNGNVILFKDDSYWVMDAFWRSGPRRPTRELGSTLDRVDAAYFKKPHIMLFSGTTYYKIEVKGNEMFPLPGYPKLISQGFPGIPDMPPDEVVRKGNKLWFFRDGSVTLYNPEKFPPIDSTNGVVRISSLTGFPAKVSAAFVDDNENKETLIFDGNLVFVLELNRNTLSARASDSPRTLKDWLKC